MFRVAYRMIVPAFLALGIWLVSGCAQDRTAEPRTDQTYGYVEPEQRYSEREYQEHFRPQVPKMY